MITIHHADCISAMRSMPAESVDACVTDAPYGLGKEPPIVDVLTAWLAGEVYKPKGAGFMGREWDAYVPGPEVWREVLRVLKPGGHLLSFFGTRTYDVGTLAIRLAGFEMRDQIDWLYGQGFPKSLDVSKAIDKAAGAERDVIGTRPQRANGPASKVNMNHASSEVEHLTVPATPEAARWSGWGTALKPSHEPICVARKPLAGTVEANVRRYGTGAINVDGCRIGMSDEDLSARKAWADKYHGRDYAVGTIASPTGTRMAHCTPPNDAGRWPANVVIDEAAAAVIDAQSGRIRAAYSNDASAKRYNDSRPDGDGRKSSVYSIANVPGAVYADDGGASRFFYVAKASNNDRGEENIHETVKPLALMRWLVRLVTPPGGLVLDPFAGSGTTGLAAMAESMSAILVEREADYVAVIKSRLAGACDVVEGDGRREATERKRKKREQIGLFG